MRSFLAIEQPHPHLVLCGVATERDLLAAADRLERAGIRFALFREPDRNDEVTALATEPLGSARRGVLGRYRCLTRSDLLSAPTAPGQCDLAPRTAPAGSLEDVPMT